MLKGYHEFPRKLRCKEFLNKTNFSFLWLLHNVNVIALCSLCTFSHFLEFPSSFLFLCSTPPSTGSLAIQFVFTKIGAVPIPTKCSLSQSPKIHDSPLSPQTARHMGAARISIRDVSAVMLVITDSVRFALCISVLHPLELSMVAYTCTYADVTSLLPVLMKLAVTLELLGWSVFNLNIIG